MKKIATLFITSLLLVSFCALGQMRQKIGSNATNIAVSATLELESTSTGFLPPRMTHQQRNAIVSPVAGLIVWCTNCSSAGELQVYNGTTWTNIIGGAASFAVPDAPTSPIATASATQASVAFTAPTSNGGSTITSYTVTSSPGGFTASGTTSPLTVTGLTNGTAYTFTVTATNVAGSSLASTASAAVTPVTVPDAPTSPIATAGNTQASVAFTAPVSNGGSAITSYTVTASPGGAVATGTTSPLIITGLTNGTPYTFNVVATNAAGNSLPSAASNAVTPNLICGAFVSAGVFKQFMCFNLGATDITGDPNVPVQAIHGNYYQWGRNTVVANASTADGAISGWNTTPAANSAWLDASKTVNDPCPTGFRVPTKTEWVGVINTSLNTVSRTGSWLNSSSNFTTAISFGTPTIKTLTLPAAGVRFDANGSLVEHGSLGRYWSSTEAGGGSAQTLTFNSSNTWTTNMNRTSGFPIRCISE